MKRRAQTKDWLPLAKAAPRPADQIPTGEAFRPEWIDFDNGLRIGNLEPHERITQILKYYLEGKYKTPFVTDRWGRGVFWQWICWLPKANRLAKPLSSNVNFGCAKLFISADRERRIFQSGLQVERGYLEGVEPLPGCKLKDDWDWHRLLAQCDTGTTLDKELKRLLGNEGFTVEAGDWERNAILTKNNFKSARQIRDAVKKISGKQWAGFQLYYPMPEREVRSCSGYDLVQAMRGVFAEVVPAMNICMQVPLVDTAAPLSFGRRPQLK